AELRLEELMRVPEGRGRRVAHNREIEGVAEPTGHRRPVGCQVRVGDKRAHAPTGRDLDLKGHVDPGGEAVRVVLPATHPLLPPPVEEYSGVPDGRDEPGGDADLFPRRPPEVDEPSKPRVLDRHMSAVGELALQPGGKIVDA